MPLKTISATVVDAMFSETYVDTPGGEQFVGSIELQLRDVDSDNIYVKKLTEKDLCEISGTNKEFSSLEIIKIAEHLRRFNQNVELEVDDKTHLISNSMIIGGSNSKNTINSVNDKKTLNANQKFAFNPELMRKRNEKRMRNPKSSA